MSLPALVCTSQKWPGGSFKLFRYSSWLVCSAVDVSRASLVGSGSRLFRLALLCSQKCTNYWVAVLVLVLPVVVVMRQSLIIGWWVLRNNKTFRVGWFVNLACSNVVLVTGCAWLSCIAVCVWLFTVYCLPAPFCCTSRMCALAI